MNLNVSGHQLEVTPALRDYVAQRLERLRRHFGRVIDARVVLSAGKLRRRAEATVHVRGREIRGVGEDPDLYAAIDAMADKLDRQILKHKGRRVDGPRRRAPARRTVG